MYNHRSPEVGVTLDLECNNICVCSCQLQRCSVPGRFPVFFLPMWPSSHASFALRASPVSWSLGCVRWVGGGVEGWGGVRLITFNVC